MKRFTNSIRAAVQTQNWYGALTTALTLPDVCGKLENPGASSQTRYATWFETWLQPNYVRPVGHMRVPRVFLGGNDCYALRCSYLHEGRGDIEHQRAREALNRFHFITPPENGNVIHLNRVNNALQLQVDLFSLDMANAVDSWVVAVANNAEIQERMQNLLVIHDGRQGAQF